MFLEEILETANQMLPPKGSEGAYPEVALKSVAQRIVAKRQLGRSCFRIYGTFPSLFLDRQVNADENRPVSGAVSLGGL